MMTLARLTRNDSGVTAIEYALIAVFVAVAIIVAVTAVGTSLDTAYADVAAKLRGATATGSDGGSVGSGDGEEHDD